MDKASTLPLAHNLMKDCAELCSLQPWGEFPQSSADQIGFGPTV
jgi:hypothetical protein